MSAVIVLTVLSIEFLTVQIKESASQFSTPLYLPPGQKKARRIRAQLKKTRIILFRRYAESGVRIAGWFRCSLSKQTAKGIIQVVVCLFRICSRNKIYFFNASKHRKNLVYICQLLLWGIKFNSLLLLFTKRKK
jgi:hypothetical protein